MVAEPTRPTTSTLPFMYNTHDITESFLKTSDLNYVAANFVHIMLAIRTIS